MNIRFRTRKYSDLVPLFQDVKNVYANLNFDPDIKWFKIKIFFLDKVNNNPYENYFYYKSKNTLTVDKF